MKNIPEDDQLRISSMAAWIKATEKGIAKRDQHEKVMVDRVQFLLKEVEDLRRDTLENSGAYKIEKRILAESIKTHAEWLLENGYPTVASL